MLDELRRRIGPDVHARGARRRLRRVRALGARGARGTRCGGPAGRAISRSSSPPRSTRTSVAPSITSHEDVRLDTHPGVRSVSFAQIHADGLQRRHRARREPEWLTLGQAARFLGVAQSTIRKWSDQGVVPAFHTHGGHRRFRRGDLEAFLVRSAAGAPAGRPDRPARRRRRADARARPARARAGGLRRAGGGERRRGAGLDRERASRSSSSST